MSATSSARSREPRGDKKSIRIRRGGSTGTAMADALRRAGVSEPANPSLPLETTHNPLKLSFQSTSKIQSNQEDEYRTLIGRCIVCEENVYGGWYGRWAEKGTCGRVCEKEQEEKPKFTK